MWTPTATLHHGECFGRHAKKKGVAYKVQHGFILSFLLHGCGHEASSEVFLYKEPLARDKLSALLNGGGSTPDLPALEDCRGDTQQHTGGVHVPYVVAVCSFASKEGTLLQQAVDSGWQLSAL